MVTVYKQMGDNRLRSRISSRSCVVRSFRYEDTRKEQDKIAPEIGDFMFMQSQCK